MLTIADYQSAKGEDLNELPRVLCITNYAFESRFLERNKNVRFVVFGLTDCVAADVISTTTILPLYQCAAVGKRNVSFRSWATTKARDPTGCVPSPGNPKTSGNDSLAFIRANVLIAEIITFFPFISLCAFRRFHRDIFYSFALSINASFNLCPVEKCQIPASIKARGSVRELPKQKDAGPKARSNWSFTQTFPRRFFLRSRMLNAICGRRNNQSGLCPKTKL